jgi:hypothetical protein
MKKLIFVLAILLAVPAFALTLSLQQQADVNKVNVNYAGADSNNLPRAFALKIEVNAPSKAVIKDVNGFKIGESNSTNRGYGIYPATIVITANDVNVWGTPLADPCDPGAGTGLGTKQVVLEFGSLYVGAGNAPATSGTLCYVKIDPNGTTGSVIVTATEENTYRGGVVLENGTVPVPDLNATTTIVYAQPKCLKSTIPDQNEYNAWTLFGEPNCWCFKRQCRGDADGKKSGLYWVAPADLTILRSSYNKVDTILKNITNGICADFDHKKSGLYRVAPADLTILRTYYNKVETIVKCCDADLNCTLDAGDKWNFWMN